MSSYEDANWEFEKKTHGRKHIHPPNVPRHPLGWEKRKHKKVYLSTFATTCDGRDFTDHFLNKKNPVSEMLIIGLQKVRGALDNREDSLQWPYHALNQVFLRPLHLPWHLIRLNQYIST